MTPSAQKLAANIQRMIAERDAPIEDANLQACVDEIKAVLKRRKIAGDCLVGTLTETVAFRFYDGRKHD
jgi:hypothetical protein